MGAEHLAERLVQQMRRRVMGAGRRAARMIDVECDLFSDLESALLQHARVQKEAVQLLLRVLHTEQRVLAERKPAPVADLSAGFRVEWRLVDNDDAALARLQLLNALAVHDQSHDLARGRLGLVAEELGRADLLLELEPKALRRGLA